MNKYILYFFGLFIFFSPLVAQTTFSLAIDNNQNSETAVSIIQLADGSFVISSGCLINPTWKDCMQLMKTDSLGNVIWNKQYDHRKPGYRGTLEPTQDGGFTLGTWWYAAPGEPEDVFLLKFDSEGDTMWTRQFGGAGRDIGWDTAELPDGSLVVVGRTESFGNGEQDIYVIKTDAQGNFQWERTFGGMGRDVSANIRIEGSGIILISGTTSETPTGNSAGIILRLDTLGNELWRKTLLYVPGKNNCGVTVSASIRGGYIFKGCMDTIINEGEYDRPYYVGKLDEEANIEWMTFFNEAREKWVANIYEMSDGHIIVVGIDKNHPETAVNDNSGFLAKLSPQGEILWQRNYQGLDNSWQIQDMCLTLDGGFALVGRYRNIIDEPDNEGDVWLLKVDSMGCLEPGCGSDLIRVPSQFVYTDIEEVPAPVLGVFSIYPNPSTHSTIAYFEEKADRLLIQDITGKTILNRSIEESSQKVFIATSTFKNGLYIATLSLKGKPVAKNKLIVIH